MIVARIFLLAAMYCVLPSTARAEPWNEDKVFFTESAKLGSSMVDAADLDGDGWIDLVFANGGGYDKGDMLSDLPQQAFKNLGGTGTMDISADIFAGANSFNGRAVKIRDIDRDGDNDIMLGCTWQKQSHLFLNTAGVFNNATESNLPQYDASIGDLELGDVDGDGDLDMILADWGPDAPVGDPVSTEGGITQLWLQDGEPASFNAPGTGTFNDATRANMPPDKVRWSWDLEFVDIDNDWDLDIVVSCFACSKQSVLLFANDGAGLFANVTGDNVTQGLGAFDVEAIDINGDAFLDLVTLRDGTGGRNRVLLNDKNGGFKDNTDLIWPKLENPASFDHMQAFLDYNSDGKPDIVLGAFNPGKIYPDRLMENQGDNTFKQNIFAFNTATPATYALILADFNKDRILDVAQAQNENSFDKKVFLGSNVELLPDTAAPIFNNYQKLADNIEFGVDHTLKARVHDNKSPLMLHDFQSTLDGPDGRPYVESWGMDPGDPDINPGDISAPGEWYGEYLWRITFNVPKDVFAFYYRLCAIDAAGNKYCTGLDHVDPVPETTGSDSNLSTDTGTATSASGTGASDSATGDDTLPTTTDQPTAGLSTSDMTTNSAGSSESMASEGTALLNDGGCICQARPKSPGGGLWLPILALAFRRPRRMPSPNAARSVIPSPSARACPSPTSAPPCRS